VLVSGPLVKVADFGTSRFLEIAAHGTTVIGSPPYMAPEQFQGRAVFASDIYSLGITMYQMLIGTLPYEAPAPGDLDKLMTGELVSPPRMKNRAIPRAINDVIMRALSPDVASRYQRAGDLLQDLLAARPATLRRALAARFAAQAEVGDGRTPPSRREDPAGVATRLRAREGQMPRFCWHCRKPLHARSDRCPFCGETQ
jgi:serine/threonine protein kinase